MKNTNLTAHLFINSPLASPEQSSQAQTTPTQAPQTHDYHNASTVDLLFGTLSIQLAQA